MSAIYEQILSEMRYSAGHLLSGCRWAQREQMPSPSWSQCLESETLWTVLTPVI